MTVKELREALASAPDEAIVVMECNGQDGVFSAEKGYAAFLARGAYGDWAMLPDSLYAVYDPVFVIEQES